MGIELVLNELSFVPPAPDKAAARLRVEGFHKAATAAMKMGVNHCVRCPAGFQRNFLAVGYSMGDWLSDKDVSRDLRMALKSWFTKAPYWQGEVDLEQKVHSRMFVFDGRENAVGMGVASLLNGLGVSFLSDEIWNRSSVEIQVLTEFFNGEDALTQDENVLVRHVSHANHMEAHKKWVEESLALDPKNGQELWDKQKEWFPKLDFCEKTKLQLLELPRQMLPSVTEQLAALQQYCTTWETGNFDPSQFPPKRIERETEITLEKFGAERTFTGPDGKKHVFSWHIRLTPLAWRIYFEAVPSLKRLLIGYVGPHLRTARFNN